MPLIALSAMSHLPAGDLAAQLAQNLGFSLVDEAFLEEVASRFGLEAAKLRTALGHSQAWRRQSPLLRARLLAYLQAALLERLEQGRVVSSGLAAHLFVRGVSHLLKVRLIADTGDRLALLAQEQGLGQVKAHKLLADRDQARRRWSQEVCGEDESAPGLYDLVLNLSRVDPDQAVRIIADTASTRRFQPMTFSQDLLRDQALASRVRAELLRLDPEVRVSAGQGRIWVRTLAVKRQQDQRVRALTALARGVAGVSELEVQVLPDFIGQAADTMR